MCSPEGLGDGAMRDEFSIYTSGFGFLQLQHEGVWDLRPCMPLGVSPVRDQLSPPFVLALRFLDPRPRHKPCVNGRLAQWLSLLEADKIMAGGVGVRMSHGLPSARRTGASRRLSAGEA